MAIDQRAAESLAAFWAEAGVDALYHDAPVDRMAARAALPAGVAARPGSTKVPVAATAAPPMDLAEIRRLAPAATDLPSLSHAIAELRGCGTKGARARHAVCAR